MADDGEITKKEEFEQQERGDGKSWFARHWLRLLIFIIGSASTINLIHLARFLGSYPDRGGWEAWGMWLCIVLMTIVLSVPFLQMLGFKPRK